MPDNRNRQPKGVSTGGQYAQEIKGEPEGLSLAATQQPSVEDLGAAYLRAEELSRFADMASRAVSSDVHLESIQLGGEYFHSRDAQYGLPDYVQESYTDTIDEDLRKLAGYSQSVPVEEIHNARRQAESRYMAALKVHDRANRQPGPLQVDAPDLPAGFTDPAFTSAAASFHRFNELNTWVAKVRAEHPGADRIHLSGRFVQGANGQQIISETRRRSITEHSLDAMRPMREDAEGYVKVADINDAYASAQLRYGKAMIRAMLPDTNSSTLYKVPKLPVALPQGWKITTIDDDNGVTASLIGPGDDAAMNVWIDDEGEADGDQIGVAPDWMEEHHDAIFETLRVTALNRESISAQLRGGLMVIPGVDRHIDALCSEGQ